MNSIDVDTGGTFTDGVFRHGGRVVTAKVDTTPHDPVRCFVACIEAGAALLGEEVPALLASTDVIRYSTTAATNAMIQRRGARIGLIVTRGAEDSLYWQGDGDSPIRPLIEAPLVRGIDEAVDADGVLRTALDADGLRAAAEDLLDNGARLLVVALGNAALNPANEVAARQLFRDWFPSHYLGTPFVLLSHEVSARGSNAECLHSAVLSGYLHRQLVSYLYKCDDAVRSRGFRHPLLVVHSSGGLARVAKTKALNTYNSGPTAGVYGAARIARRLALPRVLTADIGGTSTDVAFIADGKVTLSFNVEIEGIPVNLPMIDVLGLGGGGGSFARVEGGELMVGPDSAGAVPGPACYDLGNNRPTVTDADLVLGYIDAGNFLGGRRPLQTALARAAVESAVAQPLGIGAEAAALAVRKVLAGSLARQIAAEAARRDFPLADAVLFAYGGAGPLHAVDIAEALGMRTFMVFPESPVFSAAGSSTMQVSHIYEARVRAAESESAEAALARAVEGLMQRARRDVRGEGFDFAAAIASAELEARDGSLHRFDPAAPGSAAERAADALLRLTVTLADRNEAGLAPVRPAPADAGRARSERAVHWAEGMVATPVHALAALAPASALPGPVLIETAETTCVVPRGWTATTDDNGAIRVQKD